jgi:uncharacterized membrane protein
VAVSGGRSEGAAWLRWLAVIERTVGQALSWLLRHWLAIFVVAWGTFTLLAVAAPVLAATGHDRASEAIYLAYRVTCHQLPHRSWFIGGRAPAYDWETIRTYLGLPEGAEAATFHRPIRDPVLGYQMAFCQRDLAIHAALVLTAIGYAVARRRGVVRSLRLRYFLIALLPIAIDGGLQLFGIRESTPLSRTVTGALFGVATGLLLLPELDAGAREFLAEAQNAAPAISAGAAPPNGELR